MKIPQARFSNNKDKALKIIGDIDPGDALYITCALSIPKSVIWSDDKALNGQDKIKILNTKEMISML